MKSILITVLFLLAGLQNAVAALPAGAATLNCGEVKILEVVTGELRGSLMRVAPVSGGLTCQLPNQAKAGWVCLENPLYQDVQGQGSASRLFSEVMALYLANRTMKLSIYDASVTNGSSPCGKTYPSVSEAGTL